MPSTDTLLTGRPWKRLKEQFRTACAATDAPCWLCHQPIDYAIRNTPGEQVNLEAFEPDHFHPRNTHPHLTLDPANLRPSHLTCNRARGKNLITNTLGTPSRQWTKT